MTFDRNAPTLLDRAVQAKKLTENALRMSGQHVQKARDINRDVQTESFATDKLRQRVYRLDQTISAHEASETSQFSAQKLQAAACHE